ncbi:MAG: glycoside hydrolase family 127 protein, partial [Rhizobiaceae bacterium]|nr:glycoside hydrolase family 127 protein [Rhizobiaceae bacterium]
WKWHYCPCCPTNIARFITSLGQYFYSTTEDELAVHLYGANAAELTVGNTFVRVKQDTAYPWDGDIRLQLSTERPSRFTVRLRIPGWCRSAEVSINGAIVDLAQCVANGYAAIEREWQDGDEIRLALSMPIDRIYAHPAVSEDGGRVALQRGPVVYCIEETDLGGEPQRLRLPASAEISPRYEAGLLGGAVVLEGTALEAETSGWENTLYRTTAPKQKKRPFKAIPYHLWANRDPGAMAIWLQEG